MSETKKPTGLKIARDGGKFTLSWKIGDKNYNSGVKAQYRLLRGKTKVTKWADLKVASVRTTSAQAVIKDEQFYPNAKGSKIDTVQFRVKGKRSSYTKKYKEGGKTKTKTVHPKWSDWSPKSFSLAVPNNPTVSAALSDSQSNVTTFSWATNTSPSDARNFRSVVWESILVQNCGTTKGADMASKFKSSTLGWQTNTSTLGSSSKAISENTSTIAGKSYTRWFRVKARGLAGDSAWAYSRHVYASPNKPEVKGDILVTDNGSGGYQCKVTWNASESASRPIDSVTVQYLFVTPAAGLTCPTVGDNSWTDADVIRDTAGSNDALSFATDQQCALDQCMFVRINTTHDRVTTKGVPTLAKIGWLTDPSGVSVQTNESTHKATITATNGSSVPDSFLAVTYIDSTDADKSFVVGIIPHGSTSVQVQCPDWTGQPAVAFSVRAVVGSYTAVTRPDGADCYSVTERMVSQNTVLKGGAVPTPPSNVNVSATNIPGTIRVTWDWSWADATAAELSWADHEDAWESTDEPETYEISTLRAGAWNISGLETGQTWYIRVRLKEGNGEEATYGPYSTVQTIDLSSAPSVPVLYLSDGVITEDGEVTASWAYTSTDGTAQSYAEICEATVTGGGITYSEPIARTQTAQHVTIRPTDPDVNWSAGTTHLLCVRVVSASGRTSDAWSDPVSVTVAEPLSVAITQSSLVWDTVEENVEEYSGELIQVEDGDGAPLIGCVANITPKQSGTGTPSPSNVRAISGWESVDVNVTGKNLLEIRKPTTTINGVTFTVNSDGTVTCNGTATANAYFPFLVSSADKLDIPDGNYYLSGCPSGGSGSTYYITANNGSWKNDYGNGVAITSTNKNIASCEIAVKSGTTVNNLIFRPQLELGTTATEYEPYNGHTTTTSLGRTVYGGTLDVVSGVLTVDKVGVDLGSLTWSKYGNYTDKDRYVTTGIDSSVKNDEANAICSIYPRLWGANGWWIGSGSGKLSIFTTYGQYSSVSAFKTAMSGQILCYPLAETQTYTLTGQEISTLVGQNNIWANTGSLEVKTGISHTGWYLNEMPLTVTATGAGEGGTTSIAIDRNGSYYLDRPDESTFHGHDGETVALTSVNGEAQAEISVTDLLGPMDDGANYNLTASISDGLGQSASTTIPFTVKWSHQALVPTATCISDASALITKITPVAPAGTIATDTFDIYRLSADKPELIVEGGQWGTTYVDPYPAIGDMGGHRVVFKTANGDYITQDNELAWADLGEDEGDYLDINYSLIDFNGVQIPIRYNMDFDNSWSKDFQETKYLGGSVQGDWNPAVSRTGSLNAVCLTEDIEVISALRRLAVYPGICHVRTVDGSSYTADVQVKDSYSYDNAGKIASFSLSITRVDTEELDGMTLAQWEA